MRLLCGSVADAYRPLRQQCGAGSNELQGMQRAASGVHEELRRSGVQDRIQDVHESLR